MGRDWDSLHDKHEFGGSLCIVMQVKVIPHTSLINILFIGSKNLLSLLPHSFIPATQLSINLGIAIPL